MKILFIISVFLCNIISAQILYVQKTYRLPKFIKESSGICKMPDGKFLTFNDSGNSTDIYVLDNTAQLVNIIKLKGVKNIDWEAVSACDNTVYVADIGNNYNYRNVFELYRFTYNTKEIELIADKITFTYKHNIIQNKNLWGHHYDSEAILCYKNNLYLFSKNRSRPYNGICYLYKINLNNNNVIVPVDSINLGTSGFFSNSVTDAALSPSGKKLALITTKKIFLFYDFDEAYFFKGKYAIFTFDKFTQKEGVCFLNNDTLVVTDENNRFLPGGNMYYYDVGSYFNGCKTYRIPQIEQVYFKITPQNKANEYRCALKIKFSNKFINTDTINIEIHTPEKGKVFLFKTVVINNTCNYVIPFAINKTFATQKLFLRIYHHNKLIYSSKIYNV